MTEDERIQRHLDIAQQVFERLSAEGRLDEIPITKTVDDEGSASPKVT